jgi:hypothetical protein
MTVVVDGTSGITTNSGTVVSTTDATLNGLTVGKGGGATSTNTAVGASALNATNTIGNCTAFGYQALTLTTGKQNTAVGSGAGASMTSGEGLAAFGWNAANLNTADSVTAIGHNCLGANTTGANNVGVGNAALTANTTGASNVAVGRQALVANLSSSNNVSLGYQSMFSYQTGGDNVAIGAQAGYTLNGNGNSVFVGRSAGQNATGGNQTLVGYQAGANISTGATNLCLGYQAGANATNLTTGTQNILIGYQTNPSAGGVNYEIVMTTRGGSGKGTTTGYIDPQGGGVYQGNNSAAWSVSSDRRLKKNIVDNTEGLNIVSQIRVRNFEYRTAEEVTELPAHTVIDKQGVQLGVIAQELLEVCGDCVKTESTGVMSVNQDNLTWHMINAIKDLKALVDAQATEITALKAKVA